jgi:hypothetical protein
MTTCVLVSQPTAVYGPWLWLSPAARPGPGPASCPAHMLIRSQVASSSSGRTVASTIPLPRRQLHYPGIRASIILTTQRTPRLTCRCVPRTTSFSAFEFPSQVIAYSSLIPRSSHVIRSMRGSEPGMDHAPPQLTRRQAKCLAKGLIEDGEILKACFEGDECDRQGWVAQQAPRFAQPRDANVCMRSRANDSFEATYKVGWAHRCQRGELWQRMVAAHVFVNRASHCQHRLCLSSSRRSVLP